MLTRIAAVAAAASLLLAAGAGAALSREPECERVDPRTGRCTITVGPSRPAPGAAPAGAPGDAGGAGAGQEPQCAEFGLPVPCSSETYGTWSNALNCYLKPWSPQPPPDSPLWAGNYPRGAVYHCVSATNYPGTTTGSVWLPGPPEAGLSPAAAAQAVVRRMDLRAAEIGIVPEDRPGSIGAVGAPVYMWTTPGPTTFGPQVLTGSAGGVTITATAKVDRIEWSMGDGGTVTCRTPGTVYEDRYGFGSSPDCGYRYQRTSAGKPGNAYPIVATSYWVVDWTGPAGSSGKIPLTLESRTSIVVGELQALVTG